jgi:hypothetical protein
LCGKNRRRNVFGFGSACLLNWHSYFLKARHFCKNRRPRFGAKFVRVNRFFKWAYSNRARAIYRRVKIVGFLVDEWGLAE